MPSIPKYTGNVQEVGIPTNRVAQEAPLSAFGGGDAVAGAYQAAQGLVQDIEKRIDTTAVIEADNALTEAKNNILNKVRQVKGKDAAGAQDIAQEAWDKEIEKINGNLNPRQQQKFAGLASQGWQQIYSSVQDHTNSELKSWEKNTKMAGIKTAQKDTINRYLTDQGGIDIKLVQENLGKQNAILDTLATSEGYGIGSEQDKLLKLEASTQTHSGVLQDLLSRGLDMDAKKYFNTFKDQIDKEAAKGIIKDLETGATRSIALTAADEALAKGLNESQAEKYFKEKFGDNADARVFARSQFGAMFQDKKNGIENGKKQVDISASNYLDKNGGNVTDPAFVAKYWNNADSSQRQAWTNYGDLVQNGFAKRDDPEVKNALRDKLLDPNVEVDDSEIRESKLSTTTKTQLYELNDEKKANSEKYQKMIGEYGSEKDMIGNKAKELGIKNQKYIGAFRTSAQAEIKAEEELIGRKLKTEEKQKIIDKLALKQSTGWFSSDYGFNIKPDQKIKEIPASELSEINAAIDYLKLTSSPALILKMYNDMQEKNAK